MKRRIGILGGTFNPVHMGHLLLAEWALETAALEEVWLIPAGMPYLKDPGEILPGKLRLHMVKLAIDGNRRLKCMDMEVRRERQTYSYETLELLRLQYPENEFFFILGADCLFSIESWKNPERIFRSCTILAAVRHDADLFEMEEKKSFLEQKYQGEIRLFPFVRMSLSSTLIRERIRRGQSVRYLVPEKVLSYIREKGLYREESYQLEKNQKSNETESGCQTI